MDHQPINAPTAGPQSTHVMTSSQQTRMVECERCRRDFQTVKVLRRHISYEHNRHLSIYKCEWCEKPYQSISAMRRHAQRKHPDITVREQAGYFTDQPANDAVAIPRMARQAPPSHARQPPVNREHKMPRPSTQQQQIVPGVNPMIPGPSTVRFRTVTSNFQPTHKKKASKTLPFSRPAPTPLLTNTPTTPGTPVQDEPSAHVTPRLAQVNTKLHKHAQVTSMDSFINHPDLTTHPDMANFVNLVSDSDSDSEYLPPVTKYPRRTLSADTTLSTEPTNSPCPLAAALGYPSGSSPTGRPDNTQPMPSTSSTAQHVPSRWDTPLVNPSPGFSTVTSYRINTPTKPTSTNPQINLPPVVSDNPGIPPDPPANALHLLADYQSSSSAEPSPAKPPELNQDPTPMDSTSVPLRPRRINPATVTPTRQEPIQISLDEAVDLLNELRTICEILLPGHGQFLCHFIYLYFLQHIQLP